MGLIRSHELEDGRTFDTCTCGGASVVIPISQLQGMSAEQIGTAVLSLMDEAIITSLLDWLDCFEHNAGRLQSYPEKQRFTQICTRWCMMARLLASAQTIERWIGSRTRMTKS
jgi:hypothetical protein